MNGPLKFLTARKILPLLNLLAKFKRVLACLCSQKNRSARHARECLQRPFVTPKYQSSLLATYSTVTALLEATDTWAYNIDRGKINTVVFLDLKKAFDTVDSCGPRDPFIKTKPLRFLKWYYASMVSVTFMDRSLFATGGRGGAEDLGLNKVKFSRPAP